MTPAMSHADALMVLSRLATRFDELHTMVGGHANHYAARQRVQPSPATAVLVDFLRAEAEALGHTRSRILTVQRDMIAGAAMRDAAFDAELKRAEASMQPPLRVGSIDRGLDYVMDNEADVNDFGGAMHEADIIRITGHGDTPSTMDEAA